MDQIGARRAVTASHAGATMLDQPSIDHVDVLYASGIFHAAIGQLQMACGTDARHDDGAARMARSCNALPARLDRVQRQTVLCAGARLQRVSNRYTLKRKCRTSPSCTW